MWMHKNKHTQTQRCTHVHSHRQMHTHTNADTLRRIHVQTLMAANAHVHTRAHLSSARCRSSASFSRRFCSSRCCSSSCSFCLSSCRFLIEASLRCLVASKDTFESKAEQQVSPGHRPTHSRLPTHLAGILGTIHRPGPTPQTHGGPGTQVLGTERPLLPCHPFSSASASPGSRNRHQASLASPFQGCKPALSEDTFPPASRGPPHSVTHPLNLAAQGVCLPYTNQGCKRVLPQKPGSLVTTKPPQIRAHPARQTEPSRKDVLLAWTQLKFTWKWPWPSPSPLYQNTWVL